MLKKPERPGKDKDKNKDQDAFIRQKEYVLHMMMTHAKDN